MAQMYKMLGFYVAPGFLSSHDLCMLAKKLQQTKKY